MGQEKGSIEIYCGCMFSGKTSKTINIINSYNSIGKRVLNINYILDVRYGKDQIISHDNQRVSSINIEKLEEIKQNHSDDYNSSEIICINEAQFFKDLKDTVLDFCNNDGKKIIISGLDGDYQQNPFGQILDLIPHSEKITKLHAFCKICNDGTAAYFTKRITNNTETVLIGGSESYIPVCRKHLN